jgi:hypothetical protein
MDLTGQAYCVTKMVEDLVAAVASCGVPYDVYAYAAETAGAARKLANRVQKVEHPTPTPTPSPTPSPTPAPTPTPTAS